VNGPRQQLWVAAVLTATVGGLATLGAHDPSAPAIVEVTVRPQANRVVVEIRLPAAALADANLPADADGRLPESGLDATLALIGRGTSQALEVRAGETRLAEPEVHAATVENRTAAHIQLTYVRPADDQPLSARLQQFRVGASRIRTLVRYEAAPGHVRTFDLAGDYERVVFDPPAGPVLRDFAARGLQALLAAGVYLLIAGALVTPLRKPRTLVAVFAAFIAGQSLSLATSGLADWALSPSALATARVVTASAVVVLAAIALLAPDSRWVAAAAAIAGLFFGVDAAAQFWSVSAFAGARTAAALAAFTLTLSLGQAWILALLSGAAGLVCRWGVPERWGSVAIAVVVAHVALHRVAESVQPLAESADRVLILLAAGWAAAILGAGLFESVFRGSGGSVQQPPPPAWASAGQGGPR
jgi:hypothetical protein